MTNLEKSKQEKCQPPLPPILLRRPAPAPYFHLLLLIFQIPHHPSPPPLPFKKRGESELWYYSNVTGQKETQKSNISSQRKKRLYSRKLISLYLSTAQKVSVFGVIFGPYFPALAMNMERYRTALCIQSECGKIRSRKTPNKGTFHAVCPQIGLSGSWLIC